MTARAARTAAGWSLSCPEHPAFTGETNDQRQVIRVLRQHDQVMHAKTKEN